MNKIEKIKIDKGIPVMKFAGRRKGENQFPFAEMKVGDSFFVALKNGKKLSSLRTSVHTNARLWSNYHKKDWKWSTSVINQGNGVRIWRTQ